MRGVTTKEQRRRPCSAASMRTPVRAKASLAEAGPTTSLDKAVGSRLLRTASGSISTAAAAAIRPAGDEVARPDPTRGHGTRNGVCEADRWDRRATNELTSRSSQALFLIQWLRVRLKLHLNCFSVQIRSALISFPFKS
uniref:Uncharacterized protein n=1 Tax=Oryza nivara TaxID=4536 RepID=A0A0E0H134_ORYNI